MKFRYLNVILLSVLLAFGAPAMAQQGETSYEGEVVNVRDNARQISVRLQESGETRTYTVDDDTEFRLEGSYVFDPIVGLEDIEAGDTVRLVVDGSTDGERTRRVERDRDAAPAQHRDAAAGYSAHDEAEGNEDYGDRETMQARADYTPDRLPATARSLPAQVLATALFLFGVAVTLRLVRAQAAARKRHDRR